MKQSHIALKVIIGVLAVICLAGVALSIAEFINNNSKENAITKSEKALKSLCKRGDKPALTEKNVETSEINVQAIEKAQKEKTDRIKSLKSLNSNFKGGTTDFVSTLLQKKNTWAGWFKNRDIEVDSPAQYFGFSRYLQSSGNAGKDMLQKLDTEANIIQQLLDALTKARDNAQNNARRAGILAADKQIFTKVLKVRREAIELNPNQPRGVLPDEFMVTPVAGAEDTGLVEIIDPNGSGAARTKFISVRRNNVVNAYAFQLQFASSTDVLRDFIAGIEGYPLFVRSITAERATKDILPAKPSATAVPANTNASAFDFFGTDDNTSAAPAFNATPAKAPTRSVVVEELPEVFTVTFEYLGLAKPEAQPATTTNSASDDDEND